MRINCNDLLKKIWNENKVIICVLFVVTAIVIGGIFLYIFWPKVETDLKSHKNYSKFSRESCTVNGLVTIEDDISSSNFPWLVRILRKNGSEDAHSCTAALIASKSSFHFIFFKILSVWCNSEVRCSDSLILTVSFAHNRFHH